MLLTFAEFGGFAADQVLDGHKAGPVQPEPLAGRQRKTTQLALHSLRRNKPNVVLTSPNE